MTETVEIRPINAILIKRPRKDRDAFVVSVLAGTEIEQFWTDERGLRLLSKKLGKAVAELPPKEPG